MTKIVVVGVAGTGKSTLARSLAQVLRVPHIELDALFWQPNWQKTSEDEFERLVTTATSATPGWVADGNYSDRIRSVTWGSADLVVWLDYPRCTILRQLLVRTVRRIWTREEIWNGNRERPLRDQLSMDPSRSIIRWALRSYRPTKRKYARLMLHPEFRTSQFVRLRSRRETQEFLKIFTSIHREV